MPRYSGFVGPSYEAPSIVAADDQTINLIPAKIESGTGAGNAQYVFDPSPGFNPCVDTGHGACQGSYEINGFCYMAVGGELVSVDASVPSFADLATIPGVGEVVSITSNGDAGHQLMLARAGTSSGGTLSWYDLTAHTSGTISSVIGSTVVFLDGYFIALDNLTSTIHVSALEDGTSWDPDDAAQRNDFPDNWRTLIVKQLELWLFGSESTSVYYNDPTSTFPFVPNTNVSIMRGINAPNSLQLLQGSPVWLADDLTVRYAQGYTPVRISTHAVEFSIGQQPSPAAADGAVYNLQGHAFYVLTFPPAGDSGGVSWVYDLTSGLWHQVGTYDAGTDNFGIWPAIYATTSAGFQIVGSRTDGKIYFMQPSHATEFDATTGITRRRRAPQLVSGDLDRVIYDKFQLFMEVGLAPASGPGSTPTVLLQYSNDGGQTFNAGVTRSVGLHNAFNARVIWRNLGQGRQRVFQITMRDPIPWRLVDAFVDMRAGPS